MLDRDDWSIHPVVFQQLDRLWGPHTIDRFANYVNPLMAVAAIWRFEVITRAAVSLNPADMYLYAFQCSMRLF